MRARAAVQGRPIEIRMALLLVGMAEHCFGGERANCRFPWADTVIAVAAGDTFLGSV